MTLRQAISRQQHIGATLTYGGVAWVTVVLGLSNADPPWAFLAIPGIVAFIAGTLYQLFFVRCPRCRGRLGQIIGPSAGLFSISSKVRFCPLCGVALDMEVAAHRAP